MRPAACLCFCSLLLWAAEPAKGIFDKAVKALAAKDYAAAERGFESVLRVQPRHVGALGNLGVVYSRTARPDQAIAVYRRALRLSPDGAERGEPELRGFSVAHSAKSGY